MKQKLSSNFDMKDLGEIRHVLGMQVQNNREDGSLKLSQEAYAETILKRFEMISCKEINTPMEGNIAILKETSENLITNVPYRELIGSIMYLMLGTRPDLCYSIGVLSQFSEEHGLKHWKACKRVLRYIQKTKTYGLFYQATSKPKLHIYSDASCGNTEDRKSISGFATFFGECLQSWSSRKQRSVALSSTEAELIAVSEAVKEGQWLSKILNDLARNEEKQITVSVDNQSTISISKKEGAHGKSKDIAIRYFYIQDCTEKNEVRVLYCRIGEMLADILTKPLQKTKHWYLMSLLGLKQL